MDIKQITSLEKDESLILIPELEAIKNCDMNHPTHQYDILTHSLKSAEQVEEPLLKLVLVLHDIGKPASLIYDEKKITRYPNHNVFGVQIAYSILKQLQVKQEEIDKILILILYHDTPIDTEEKMQYFIKIYGIEIIELLLKVQSADLLSHTKKYADRKAQILKQSYTLLRKHIDEISFEHQKNHVNNTKFTNQSLK